jgi:ABC-type uncharacterized transport system substrate-binding protein
VIAAAGLSLVEGCAFPVQIRNSTTVRRIAYITGAPVASEDDALRLGLREHGWTEGDNLAIERRYYGGSAAIAVEQVQEVLSAGAELIVTAGSIATVAASSATNGVPIVMVGVVDPVGLGIVSNLAHPGANLTGNAYQAGPLASKQLELLRDVTSGGSRVALLFNPESPGNVANAREHHAIAPALGLDLQDVPVREAAEIPAAFDALRTMKPDSMRLLSEEVFNAHKVEWLGFASTERLPAMYQQLNWVAAGGLMAYLANLEELIRRGGIQVDKILRGARPGDLPIEQPTRFEFHINRKTAESLGITIPDHVAVQVTHWIE